MASTVTVRTGGSGIDTSDFKAVVKALRKAEPVLNREVRRELRSAGEIVAVEAKAIASQWSKSIPPTIKVRTSGASVAIEAGGVVNAAALAREMFDSGYGSSSSDKHSRDLDRRANGAVIAALFELGNTGDARSSVARGGGTFRHPVFGNRDNWVEQPMHPYLAPAALANLKKIDERIFAALDKVTDTIVLEG